MELVCNIWRIVMKRLPLLVLFILGATSISFAQASLLETAYGGTHNVKPYSTKNGTFVPEHRAGNPNSGVHCHNNVCY